MGAAVLLLAGCNRAPVPPVERLVILTGDNLSADFTLDWVERAVPSIAAEMLTGSTTLEVRTVASMREADSFRATLAAHSYFTARNGQVEWRLVVEDLESNKMAPEQHFDAASPEGILGLARAVAGALGTPVRGFGAENPAAIQAYGEALIARGEPKAEALERALAADPGFPEAMLDLARLRIAEGKQAPARVLLERVLGIAGLDAVTAARTRLLLATVRGDHEAAAAALEAYARLLPADAEVMEQAARAVLARHHYREAADWYLKAARIDPGRPDLWNASAYPLAYAGDREGALDSLRRYQQARPKDPNVYDSLGEIQFRFGDFEAAENYFHRSYEENPEFHGGAALAKVARCRLMLGDSEGARKWFDQFAASRREIEDPTIDLYAGQWLYWTGHHAEAEARLDEIASKPETPATVRLAALVRLTIWAAFSGDLESAERHSRAMIEIEGGGAVSEATLLARLLSQPRAGPAEWRRRASFLYRNLGLERWRREALLAALLRDSHLAAARDLAQEIYDAAVPFSRDELQVVLAGLLIETGEAERAGKLLATNPILQPGAESRLHLLVFPRIFYLRGRLAREAGDTETATGEFRLFLSYLGDVPGPFGEGKRARSLLAGS